MNDRKALVLLLVLLCSGCAMFEKSGPAAVAIDADQEESVEQIIQHIEEMDELYDTVVIASNEQTLVSYKVKHLHRFKMKAIESDIESWLKESFPDQEVDVSSDYKIFLSSFQLHEQWVQRSITAEQAKEDLQLLIDLKEERT